MWGNPANLGLGLDADVEGLDAGGECTRDVLPGEDVEEVEARLGEADEAPPLLHHRHARLVHATAAQEVRAHHLGPPPSAPAPAAANPATRPSIGEVGDGGGSLRSRGGTTTALPSWPLCSPLATLRLASLQLERWAGLLGVLYMRCTRRDLTWLAAMHTRRDLNGTGLELGGKRFVPRSKLKTDKNISDSKPKRLEGTFFSISHIQKIILNGVFSDPISVNHPKN